MEGLQQSQAVTILEGMGQPARFSFDITRMLRLVNVRAKAQSLLRCHFYLDHILTGMLEDHSVNTGYIGSSQNTFFNRLQIAHAMGLVPKALLAPIRKVMVLRDDMARSLQFSVTARDFAELRKTIPEPSLAYAVEQFCTRQGKPAETLGFGNLMAALVMSFDAIRQANQPALRPGRGCEIALAVEDMRRRVPDLLGVWGKTPAQRSASVVPLRRPQAS